MFLGGRGDHFLDEDLDLAVKEGRESKVLLDFSVLDRFEFLLQSEIDIKLRLASTTTYQLVDAYHQRIGILSPLNYLIETHILVHNQPRIFGDDLTHGELVVLDVDFEEDHEAEGVQSYRLIVAVK